MPRASLPPRRSSTAMRRIRPRRVIGTTTVGESEWLRPSKSGTTQFHDIAYSRSKARKTPTAPTVRVRLVQGQVVDHSGAAVPQARVAAWYAGQRLHTTADSAGRFQLQDVPAYGGWVFVGAAGFRFHGEPARPDHDPLKVVVTRSSEPAPRILHRVEAATPSKQSLDAVASYCSRALPSLEGQRPINAFAPTWFSMVRALSVADPQKALRALR